MERAVSTVMKSDTIRIDTDIHGRERWVEKRGREFYDLLKGYLEPMKTEEDILKNMEKTVYLNLSESLKSA